MEIKPGDKLGRYQLVSRIGEGGMGEVWKARDTQLDRDVALKVSKDAFTTLFDREARAIAAFNHSNICQIYDVGPNYLVMELIDGAPLTGPLPVEKAVAYAALILDALDAAHRKGFTHRDLKPANILVTRQGLKLLDFGLAKRSLSGLAPDDATGAGLTVKGEISGTLQYMSPEQLNGKEVDARSDIFAFGCVLYEILSGRKAFSGSTAASTIAAIMEREPEPLEAPPPLDRVIRKCLMKDPDERFQTARDLKYNLGLALEATAVATPSKPSRLWRSVAAVLALIALGLAGWMARPQHEPQTPITTFQVPLPENVAFGEFVTMSPDGRKMVFDGRGAPEQSGLWVRDLGALEWRHLAGTGGGLSGGPFWSPDSRFLGYGIGNQLKKIDVSGGAPPQTLCTNPGGTVGSAAWSKDGTIVFGTRSVTKGNAGMWKVSQAGGVPTAVTVLDLSRGETIHSLPTFLPDGKHFLYFRAGPRDVSGIYAASLDVKPEAQSPTRIGAFAGAVDYVEGHLFFMQQNTLMAQPFDADKMQLRGEPIPIADRVTAATRPLFSVSPGGALAYLDRGRAASRQLTWFDRQGKVLSNFGQPGTDQEVALSPDGTRGVSHDVCTCGTQQNTGDLWILDFARGARTRFTFHNSPGTWGVWSADGNRIAFAAGDLYDTVFEKAASGAGDEKALLKEPGKQHFPTGWSRDGRFLLYYLRSQKTGNDLWVLPLEGARKPVLLLGTEFDEDRATFSPDMRWLAYDSSESGRTEVYVRPLVAAGPSGAPALGEGKWQISRDGGFAPKWSSDGKQIYFGAGTGIMAMDANANGSAFEAGVPQRLFLPPGNAGWSVTGDGKRFLLATESQSGQSGQPAQAPFTVVLNWPALLKK